MHNLLALPNLRSIGTLNPGGLGSTVSFPIGVLGQNRMGEFKTLKFDVW